MVYSGTFAIRGIPINQFFSKIKHIKPLIIIKIANIERRTLRELASSLVLDLILHNISRPIDTNKIPKYNEKKEEREISTKVQFTMRLQRIPRNIPTKPLTNPLQIKSFVTICLCLKRNWIGVVGMIDELAFMPFIFYE